MSNPPLFQVYGVLILVQLIFGLHYIMTDLIVEKIEGFEWTSIRILFAGILMFLIYRNKITYIPQRHEWGYLVLLSCLGIVINTGLFTKGLELTTPAHASLLSCMIPVMTLVFAWFLGYEALNRYKTLSLLVAMSGALILLKIDDLDISSDLFLGDILVLINFSSFALFLVLSKSRIEQYSPLGLTVLVMCIGSVLLLPLSVKGMYLNYDVWLEQPWWFWCAAIYSIVFATVIAYSLNYYAMAHVEPSKVALFIYLQPVVAGFVSISLGRDEITPRLVVSSLLILCGLYLSTIESSSSPEISQ